MDGRTLLIRNKQAKLTAVYLNGVGVALAAVGGVAPVIAIVSGSAQAVSIDRVAIVSISCIVVSAILHVAARTYLKGLRV